MNTVTINGDALRRTMDLMFGPEATQVIEKLYLAINDAQKGAYELAKMEAEASIEARLDAAFDEGYNEGHGQALNESWDNGYLEGVSDARAHPEMADVIVQDIINDQPDDDIAALAFMEAEDGCDCEECQAYRAEAEAYGEVQHAVEAVEDDSSVADLLRAREASFNN